MEMSIEFVFIVFSVLILVSVFASKITDRFGIPVLILFLAIGMLAGSEGLGGIHFDDPVLTQWIAQIALAIILFSGGVDSEWGMIKPVIKEGLALSILGVLITTLSFGVFAHFILKLSWLVSFLIAAICSSTDAAAVFSVISSKGVNLKGKIAPLIEFESGSNDPIAIFLTIGLIQLVQDQVGNPLDLLLLFLLQMGVGAIVGWLVGRLALYLINRLKLGYEGLYPVLILALVFLAFGSAAVLKGSGYLAAYILGLTLGRSEFLHKQSLRRFFNGSAWLMQISLFITLGLLVFPSQLKPVILPGVFLALLLMFIARPLSVFIVLAPFNYSIREKLLISWAGLRGAVPIVLATLPLVAGIPQANLIFNLIFFVVISSVLLQGTTFTKMASWLKLDILAPRSNNFPIEIVSGHGVKSKLKELRVPPYSTAIGKAIYQLGLPRDYLVILIYRNGEYIQTNGSVVILEGDTLFSISEEEGFLAAKAIIDQAGAPHQ